MGIEAQQMAEMLRKFLSGHHPWGLDELLQGYGFPPFALPGHDDNEEPYSRLLRGTEELNAVEQEEFVRRLAAFMDRRPDSERSMIAGRWPERALFNLLRLCSAMPGDHRDTLGPRLDNMLRRAESGTGLKPEEHWSGLRLLPCLRDAVISNQVDRSRVPEWFVLIKDTDSLGGPAAQPGGGRYVGLNGIILADRPGQPNIENLGNALTLMVRQFDADGADYRSRLGPIIDRIRAHHEGIPPAYWKEHLGAVAEAEGWPEWARGVLVTSCRGLRGEKGRWR